MRKRAEEHIGEEFGIYKIIGVAQNKTKDGHSLYNAICKECGFIRTARYQRIKDDAVSVCTHRHEYKTCYCKDCGEEIPVGNLKPSEYNGRKFCNARCAASYNNSHRQTVEKHCLNCGKEIPRQNKYCSIKCQFEYQQFEWEQKWLNGEINGCLNSIWRETSKRVKIYLMKKYNNKCSQCGWGEINPYTGTIPLEVDHINGNPYDSSPDNVRLLCPNCHSLTKTYKGANKGQSRKKTWIPSKQEKTSNTA